jgi:pimeloyl-ACP methyl ester carboxylesterase
MDVMPTFTAPDGTRLAYRESGDGDPLICVPGGPTDSRYLGDLGGLSAHRRLIVLDLRGTGGSDVPADPSSYRCDRLVDDVEALRAHLGLARADLLGHSAGTNVVTQYVARFPERVGRVALIGPSTRAVGIEIDGEARREVARRREGEAWFAGAWPVLDSLTRGGDGGGDPGAIAPFFYGRWDAAAQAHHAAFGRPENAEAVRVFGAAGAFSPAATRAGIAGWAGQVLLLTGEFDVNSPPGATKRFASLFPAAGFEVQPGAGHYPWLDAAEAFTGVVAPFLRA